MEKLSGNQSKRKNSVDEVNLELETLPSVNVEPQLGKPSEAVQHAIIASDDVHNDGKSPSFPAVVRGVSWLSPRSDGSPKPVPKTPEPSKILDAKVIASPRIIASVHKPEDPIPESNVDATDSTPVSSPVSSPESHADDDIDTKPYVEKDFRACPQVSIFQYTLFGCHQVFTRTVLINMSNRRTVLRAPKEKCAD